MIMRYWWNEEEDDYACSQTEEEVEGFVAFGYEEISQRQFNMAMHRLKD